MGTDLRLIYITTESREEALKVGRILVEEKLAACVNVIDGMSSIYSWKGNIEEASECILFAKTRSANVDALSKRVLELHSYDCPCIISLKISGNEGNPEYLEWLFKETQP